MLLCLQTYFFDLVPGLNPALINYNSEFSKKLEIIVVFMLFLIFLVPTKTTKSNKAHVPGHFIVPIVVLLVGVVSISIYSSVVYQQSFIESISNGYGYLIPVAYIALIPFFKLESNVEWFYKWSTRFGLIYVSIQLIQGLVYKMNGIIFLD